MLSKVSGRFDHFDFSLEFGRIYRAVNAFQASYQRIQFTHDDTRGVVEHVLDHSYGFQDAFDQYWQYVI